MRGKSWCGVLVLAIACAGARRPPLQPANPLPARAPAVATAPIAAATAGDDAGTPPTDAAAKLQLSAATMPPPAPLAELLALPGSATTSLGGPSSGKLVGGIALPDSGPGFVHNHERPDAARFGSIELVQLIARAAERVAQQLPGSVLVVNDLGLEAGGPIAQHGSHQNGRDADILYYTLDQKRVPIPSVGVPLDPTGKGWDFKDLSIASDDQRVQLDAPRSWRFVQALLELAPESVQRIFMVEHVRSMLLAQADKVHAPKAVRERFADVTCQPEAPHDDHLHLRLFCTPQDMAAGCLDSPPVYPWRRDALKALGLSPMIASAYTKPEHDAAHKRITTPKQARAKAGRMDARVLQFLHEREVWLKRPHPGRAYCR